MPLDVRPFRNEPKLGTIDRSHALPVETVETGGVFVCLYFSCSLIYCLRTCANVGRKRDRGKSSSHNAGLDLGISLRYSGTRERNTGATATQLIKNYVTSFSGDLLLRDSPESLGKQGVGAGRPSGS